MIAAIDTARASRSEPRLGSLTPALYSDTAVHASFRNITEGFAGSAGAGVGWDFPSGGGAPRANLLDAALP